MSKKKDRKIYKYGRHIILLFLMLLVYSFATIFLETEITEISIRCQKMKKEISILKEENFKLKTEIEQLKSYERIEEIAAENNLEQNFSNIIFVYSD